MEQPKSTPSDDVSVVARRVYALVAALDLLDEHDDSFVEQAEIRSSLTGLALMQARELAGRIAD